MNDSLFMIFEALLQIVGACYAFQADGVLAKLLGLIFCLNSGFCIAAAIVFATNKKKGE